MQAASISSIMEHSISFTYISNKNHISHFTFHKISAIRNTNQYCTTHYSELHGRAHEARALVRAAVVAAPRRPDWSVPVDFLRRAAHSGAGAGCWVGVPSPASPP